MMQMNKAEAKAYAKVYVVITLLNISLKCTFKFFAIAGSREVEIRQTDRQTDRDRHRHRHRQTDRQTETATGLPAFLNASSTACLSNYMHLSFYLPTSLPVCRFI